ncbi:SMAD/FHA domain-containing protein [Echria macrotheca]|uniref:SMAD/FHA domain-containing protein n=1 Tax=Echria macrotheca TaxID=438768 RepID=A0AAJ0BFA3_9PEZI|nr:SMAD/FHA domain-containing protein [Echria macrotheca]
MSSDHRNDRRSHRRDYDEDHEGRYSSDRRHRDEPSEKHTSRRRSRDRGSSRRSRSRSPKLRDRRSRSRDREKGSDREGYRDRDREKEKRDKDRRPGKRSYREKEEERDKDGGSRTEKRHRPRDRQDGRSDSAAADREGAMNPDADRSLIRRRGPLPSQTDSFAISKGEEPEKPVEKPNFGNSGLLAAASNAVTQADGTTVTLKYHEPPEARKPAPRDVWKLFVFKGPDIVDTIELSTRSCWLVGRDSAVVDLLAEHPSISKQHAVIQFRYTEKRNEYGDKIGRVKPYLIDLESANGTRLNDDKVPESRYLELKDKDMIQFGSSTREYVLMLAPKD